MLLLLWYDYVIPLFLLHAFHQLLVYEFLSIKITQMACDAASRQLGHMELVEQSQEL